MQFVQTALRFLNAKSGIIMANHDLFISSTQNLRIKQVVKLRRRSYRDKQGLFIIEGCREIRLAINNQQMPVWLFFCEKFFQHASEHEIIVKCQELGCEIFKCSTHVFQKISYRARPEGVLAVALQVKTTFDNIKLSRHPLVIIAESIEKPGNLGTILRSADVAGVDAVIVCDQCTDIYNPNVIRASIGAIFAIPVIETSSVEALAWLRGYKIKILAATPHAQKEYTSADLRQGVGIVVGAEHAGLSNFWMSKADLQVKIPMRGQTDSLNVAATTTILLFEAVRQRTQNVFP